MITTKALIALGSVGFGAVAAAGVASMEAHSRSHVGVADSVAAPISTPREARPQRIAPHSEVVNIGEVRIHGKVSPRALAAATPARKTGSTALRECSDWRSLQNGPSDRRVRALCPGR